MSQSSTDSFYSTNSTPCSFSSTFSSPESTVSDIERDMDDFEKEVERKRQELKEKLRNKIENERQKREGNIDIFWELSNNPEYKYFRKAIENQSIIDEGIRSKTIEINYNQCQAGKGRAIYNISLIAQNKGFLTITTLLPQVNHENQFTKGIDAYNRITIDEMASLIQAENLDRLDSVSFPHDLLLRCKCKITCDGKKTRYEVDFTKLEKLAEKKTIVNRFLSYVKGEKPGSIYTIATVERLEFLEKIVSHYNPEKIQLNIDEADTLFSLAEEKDRRFTLPLSKLVNRSKIVNLFTATPVKICFDSLKNHGEEIHFGVTLLPKLDIHVSVNDYEIDTSILAERSRLIKTSQSIDEDLYELEGIIRDFIGLPTYIHEYEDKDGMPVLESKRHTMLVNVSSLKNQHDEIFKITSEIPNERFNVVNWDGDGLRVYFSYQKTTPNLKNKVEITLNGQTFENVDTGEYFLSKAAEKGVGIWEILQFINNSKYQVLHGNTIIITGKYADRGISFVSEDYKSHVTQGVYLPAKTTDATTMIQAVARQNGNFADKGCYTPKLYTNEYAKTGILYGQAKIDHLMKECAREELTKEEINDLVSTVAERENIRVTEIKFPKILDTDVADFSKGTQKKKIPKKQFCKDGKSEVNTKYETESEEIGMAHMGQYVNEEDENKFEDQEECYDSYIEDNYTEEEVIEIRKRTWTRKKESEYPSQEYTRMKRMFPKWAGKDGGKMGDFLRALDTDKFYTKDEILKICSTHEKRLALLTQKDKPRDDYIIEIVIMKVRNKTPTYEYCLHPKLVNLYKENFQKK